MKLNVNKLEVYALSSFDLICLFFCYQGFLVSDWDGLETISEPQGSDNRNCVKLGINAGIDMVLNEFSSGSGFLKDTKIVNQCYCR